MAEATAESPSTVLPDELMIEILFRVELSNPLQLRRVCKLWNSLILDPHFVKKHSSRSFTEDIYVLYAKAREHLNAFRSQLSKYPIVPLEDDDDEDEEEDDAADADEEEEEGDEEEDASAEKGMWKHWLINVIAPLDNILVEIRLLKKDLETIKADMLIQAQLIQQEAEEEDEVAQLDNLWVAVRYIKRNIKTYRVNMQILEVRVKCLKSFLQICLKLATSSSSHF